MDNKIMKYETISLNSKRLNRDVKVECYKEEEDGTTILSTNSLKKVFEGIKSEFGIVDTAECDVKFSDRGTFIYASAEWTIRDKTGYQSTFVGEATPLSLESLVAKKFPKTTALNRAQSAGIIAYLQLPGKMYSDSQVTPKVMIDEEAPVEVEDKNTAGIITKMPEMTMDSVIPAVPELNVAPEPEESLVNESTKFGISIFSDETVGNIISRYKAGDEKVVGLIKMILSGKIKPENDEIKEVIKYLKRNITE